MLTYHLVGGVCLVAGPAFGVDILHDKAASPRGGLGTTIKFIGICRYETHVIPRRSQTLIVCVASGRRLTESIPNSNRSGTTFEDDLMDQDFSIFASRRTFSIGSRVLRKRPWQSYQSGHG